MTRVGLVGDSQAGGLRVPLAAELERRGWAPTLYEYENGASTRKLLNDGRVTRVLDSDPEVLIVAAGGNDSTISQTAWRELVLLARNRGVRVFWMGPPASMDADRDQTRRAITAALRETVSQAGARFIDGRDLARGLPYADTVHLTAAGYAQLAQRLAARVTAGPSLIGLAAAGLLAGGALAWWGARATRESARTRTRTRTRSRR